MEQSEFMARIRAAKSAEEIIDLAKADGVEITLEKAQEIFECAKKSTEVSDETLDSVVGGNLESPFMSKEERDMWNQLVEKPQLDFI